MLDSLTYRTCKVRHRHLKESSYTAYFASRAFSWLTTQSSRSPIIYSLGAPYIMNVSKSKNANVQLLSCLVEPQDVINPDDSHYRFLVDGNHVKYVTTAPGTLSGEEIDWTFGPILLSELLPPFPPGNWNKGYVAKDLKTGEAAFIKAETEFLAGVENLWHPVKLNELDFAQERYVRQRVRISTHPELNDGKPVLIKLAVWPWEIAFMETETTAYECIRDRGIGPRFLGHLTKGKDGRMVGFVAEWVQDHQENLIFTFWYFLVLFGAFL